MGLFSWLFPSPEDRLARARKLLAAGEYAQARDESEGLDVAGAAEVHAAALDGLVELNLREADGLAFAGAFDRAQEHIVMAVEFAGAPPSPGNRDAIRAARRRLREARKASRQGPPKGVALANDPKIIKPLGDDPLFSLPPDDPRLRYAMALEAWPEALRARLIDLGPDFALAVNALDDGRAAEAVAAFAPFVDRDPVACYERARAARAAGDLAMASGDLRRFGREVGHRKIGPFHTGALLGQLLIQQGRARDALTAVDEALAEEPDSVPLQAVRAFALERDGRYADADELARRLIKVASRDLGLYKLMARCRLRAGKRVEAMSALDAGLTTCCTSGRCGSQPFDVQAGRMLAQLYLEDRLEPARAHELLARVKATAQPGPFEAYLDALVLRNQGDPGALEIAGRLLRRLPQGDPLQGLVRAAFPALTPALAGGAPEA